MLGQFLQIRACILGSAQGSKRSSLMEAFRPKPSSAREKRNWYIGLLYVRQDYDEALTQIEDQLRECGGLCEYRLLICAGGKSGSLRGEVLPCYGAPYIITGFKKVSPASPRPSPSLSFSQHDALCECVCQYACVRACV